MKQIQNSEETVQINVYSSDDKLWTTFGAPKAWTDRLTDYAKRAGITFDEVFEQALTEYFEKAA
jgi:hypothetical protein